jgi:hypothetical protein
VLLAESYRKISFALGVEAVKTTRYPEAGAGVGEADGDIVGVVPAVGAELHAERMPTRKIKAG